MMTAPTQRLKVTIIVAFCLALLASASAPAKPLMPSHLKVTVGQKAPDFAIPAGNGSTVRLSALRGHSVLLYFYRGYW